MKKGGRDLSSEAGVDTRRDSPTQRRHSVLSTSVLRFGPLLPRLDPRAAHLQGAGGDGRAARTGAIGEQRHGRVDVDADVRGAARVELDFGDAAVARFAVERDEVRQRSRGGTADLE